MARNPSGHPQRISLTLEAEISCLAAQSPGLAELHEGLLYGPEALIPNIALHLEAIRLPHSSSSNDNRYLARIGPG
jgi:hypothetical protein